MNEPENANTYPILFKGNVIKLYQGPVTVTIGLEKVEMHGTLVFKANPNPKTYFELFSDDRMSHMRLINHSQIHLHLKGHTFVGSVRNCSLHFGEGSEKKPDITGSLIQQLNTQNDKQVDDIYFLIPNFPDVIGKPVKIGNGTYMHRLCFGDTKIKVTIDPLPNLKEIIHDIKENHSTAITHVGRIEVLADPLTVEEIDNYLSEIGCALSFSIARLTHPLLKICLYKGQIVFQDIVSNFRISRFKSTTHWFDFFNGKDLEIYLSKHIEKFSGNHKLINFYKVLNWFTEAEREDLVLETRIIILTTALDYFAWQVLVIEFEQLSKTEFKKNELSKNLRLLLKASNIPSDLSAIFITDKVKGVCEKMDSIDGPDLIAKYRNAIIHPNRNQSIEILVPGDLYALKSLAGLYLEYLCLWYVNYDSNVVNRLKIPHYQGDYIKAPWIK